MREYGRAHTKFRDNLETAKNNELVFVNGDIVIKKEDGNNISLYDKFVNDCVDKEIISSLPVVYGFTINFNEPDPYDSISYIEDNSTFEPMTYSNNKINNNSWNNGIIRNIFGIKPCLMKDGKVIKYLNSNNYNLDIAGNNVENFKSSDVMIEFGRMWYKFMPFENGLTFKIANYKVDDTYTTIFKDKHMYISAYNVFVSNGIPSSRPGNILALNENNNIIKSKLKRGYSLLSYEKYVYILVLSWLFTKSFDPLSIIGKGSSKMTGTLDETGLFFNGNIGNKFLGLENFWQYYTYLDGVSVSKNSLYSVNKDGIKSILLQNIFKNGWINSVDYRKGILYPSGYNGSSSTHACSYITNKDESDSMSFSDIFFGGIEEDATHTGAFSLYFKEPKYKGYRLCYN